MGNFIFVIHMLSLANAQVTVDGAVDWSNPHVTEVEITALTPSTNTAYKMPLTVVISRGSSWTVESIAEFIRASEGLFLQCEISYSAITLVQLRHPQLSDFTTATDYLITRDFPPSPLARPMVIFNSGSYGEVYANAAYYKDHDFEFYNQWTVFIDSLALAIHSADKAQAYFKRTVVVHELLHTLLNVGHPNEPGNIISSVQKGEKINSAQCLGLQNHSLTL